VFAGGDDLGHLDVDTVKQATSGERTQEELLHHSLGTLIDAAELVEELFEDIPEYRLCPVAGFVPK
jgi:hypothetical protein